MDNDTLIVLLEEWVKEMKNEIKNLNICGSVLKQDIFELKGIAKSYSDIKTSCDSRFVDFEARLRSLEKSDGVFETTIEKKAGDIKEIKNTSSFDKTLLTTKIKTNENAIKKINDNSRWQWRTIFIMCIGFLTKLFFS